MAVTLSYCRQCGSKVSPYGVLDAASDDVWTLGKQDEERNTYRCDRCDTRHLRPNVDETGENCIQCQHPTPYTCKFCPRCGAKQRWVV